MTLENLQTSVTSLTDPFVTVWNQFLTFLPNLIGSALIAFFGYFITKLIGYIVAGILEKAHVDTLFKKSKRHKVLGELSVSTFIGGITRWYVFSWFIILAAEQLQLKGITPLLIEIASWIPHIIIGMLIILIGILFADVIEKKLWHAKKIKWVRLITPIIKFFIIVFFISAAAEQMGISIALAEQTFLIIVGGFVLTASLAFGIPLGLALKKDVEKKITKIKKGFK